MSGRRIIAHTLSYPPFRRIGSELATHGLLEMLAADGWDCIVVPHQVKGHDLPAAGWPQPLEVDGVHIVPNAMAEACQPDVVLAHLPFTAYAREQADRHGVPLVVSGHGGPPGWLAAKARAVDPDLVLANSRTMAAGLERTGLSVTVLRPPVWPPSNFGARMPGGTHVTLINHSRDKGGALLAELAAGMPDVGFLAVDGGYGEQVALDRHPNITVLPHGTPMAQVWERTALLLVPSAQESWGMVAVEAMMHGIPVVGSTAPGLAECLGPDMPRVDVGRHGAAGRWAGCIREHLGRDGRHPRNAVIAAVRRAAELHPAPDLIRAGHAIGRLAGIEEIDMAEAARYRNVRTGQVVEVDPNSFVGRRLATTPLVWHCVSAPGPERPPTAPVPGVAEQGEVEQGGDDEYPAFPRFVDPGPARRSEETREPGRNAPHQAWVEYAVSMGCERPGAQAATRSTLIALYSQRRPGARS